MAFKMFVNPAERGKVETLKDLLNLEDVPFFTVLLDMFDDEHHANTGNGADVLARRVEGMSLPKDITQDKPLRKLFMQFVMEYDLLSE